MTTPPDFGAAELYAKVFERPFVEDDPEMTNLARAYLALRAEVERITRERDAAQDALVSIKSLNLSVESGKGWSADMTMQGVATEMWVASLVDLFKAQGGPNYVEASVRDVRDGRTYFLIIGPHSAKSPHKLRQDAERERDQSLAELAALREDQTDLLLDVWGQFSHSATDGWSYDAGLSTLERVAADLVELGVFERHPTKDWYRRSARASQQEGRDAE